MSMGSGMKTFCLFASLAVIVAGAETFGADQAAKKKKDARPLVSVIRKDGKAMQRRCFRDNDKNGFCDNGTRQKGKCKNNCRLAVTDKEKELQVPQEDEKNKKIPPLCANCPFAGNCSGACLALAR